MIREKESLYYFEDGTTEESVRSRMVNKSICTNIREKQSSMKRMVDTNCSILYEIKSGTENSSNII